MSKINEFRALNAKWLSLAEAAFYCGFSIDFFNKTIRPFVAEIGTRPVTFDRSDLDKAMESQKIGNLPFARKGSTPTAEGGSKRG